VDLTWKCALRLWPQLASFSNQMLRYQRKPDGLIHELGLPAHRALPDAYVTAHHLRDMLNAASLDQLLTWSREPGSCPASRKALTAASSGEPSRTRPSAPSARIATSIFASPPRPG